MEPLKKVMERLSAPTGGRALFTDSIDELHTAFGRAARRALEPVPARLSVDQLEARRRVAEDQGRCRRSQRGARAAGLSRAGGEVMTQRRTTINAETAETRREDRLCVSASSAFNVVRCVIAVSSSSAGRPWSRSSRRRQASSRRSKSRRSTSRSSTIAASRSPSLDAGRLRRPRRRQPAPRRHRRMGRAVARPRARRRRRRRRPTATARTKAPPAAG